MFALVKSMYLCMTWESYWEFTLVAFVAEATMCLVLERTGFSIVCRNEASKMQNFGAHNTTLSKKSSSIWNPDYTT
jgi:hypothetical protein